MTQCTICNSPRLAELQAMIAGGMSARKATAAVGLSHWAHARHMMGGHELRPEFPKGLPRRKPEATGADDQAVLLAELVRTLRVQTAASGNPAFARELRMALDAQAKLAATNVQVVDWRVAIWHDMDFVRFLSDMRRFFQLEDPTDGLATRFDEFLKKQEEELTHAAQEDAAIRQRETHATEGEEEG